MHMQSKMSSEDLIFIVGCPRSGTTVLASTLNKHPNISSATETHFFNFVSKQKKYNWLDFTQESFDSLLDEARIGDFINVANLNKEEIRRQFKELKQEASINLMKKNIFDLLITNFLQTKNKKRFCEKTPQHLQNVLEILEIYPQAKFIHLIRDGRDTVNSLMKMPWRPPGLINNIRFWIQYINIGLKVKEIPLVNSYNFLTLKYEDLLLNPEASLRQVCKLIGEEYDSSMLDKGINDHIFADWENSWKHKASEDLDPSRIGVWKKDFNEEEALILEWLLAPHLIKLGYDVIKPELTWKEKFKLGLHYGEATIGKLRRTIAELV